MEVAALLGYRLCNFFGPAGPLQSADPYFRDYSGAIHLDSLAAFQSLPHHDRERVSLGATFRISIMRAPVAAVQVVTSSDSYLGQLDLRADLQHERSILFSETG